MHVGAEPEADHKVMMSMRVKNVRKVDSMEMNVAEISEGPMKKTRRANYADVNGVELGATTETAEPPAGAPEDCSEDAWANMTYKQRKNWRQRHK